MLIFSDQALLHQKQCGAARRVDVYWFFSFALSTAAYPSI